MEEIYARLVPHFQSVALNARSGEDSDEIPGAAETARRPSSASSVSTASRPTDRAPVTRRGRVNDESDPWNESGGDLDALKNVIVAVKGLDDSSIHRALHPGGKAGSLITTKAGPSASTAS